VQRLHDDPPWEQLRGFPAPVVKLLRIMLRTHREERPRNATELQRAIEMCIASVERDQSLRARLRYSMVQGKRWLSEHPGARAAGATFAFVLAVAGLATLVNGWRGDDAPSTSELATATAPPTVQPPSEADYEGLRLASLSRESTTNIPAIAEQPQNASSGEPAAEEQEPRSASSPAPSHDLSAVEALPPVAAGDDSEDEAATVEPAPPKAKAAHKSSAKKRPVRIARKQQPSNPLARINRSIRGLVSRLF